MKVNNVVLAAAVGYGWDAVKPFVCSLRRSGCQADIVLLLSSPDREMRAQLKAHDVASIVVQPVAQRLPRWLARKRFNKHWLGWAHRAASQIAGRANSGGGLSLAARYSGLFLHVACSRYFAYYRFLSENAPAYSRVLVSDVRDVVFQRDPFEKVWPADLMFFFEHDTQFGRDPGNDLWLATVFDAEERKSMQERRVSCSGVTAGTTPQMLRYLEAMTRELAKRTHRVTGLDGVDQAVHNWLYWNDRFPAAKPMFNLGGPVLTMHGMPQNDMIWRGDQLTNTSGDVIAVVHQYDRFPEAKQRLLRQVLA